MSIIAAIASAALVALLVWTIGAPLARFCGALLVVYSLVFVIAGDSIVERTPLLAVGVTVWLAGNFLAAYQGRCWSSRLAQALTVHTPLRYLDPVNGRERRQARRERRQARCETPETIVPEVAASDDVDVDHFEEWEDELIHPTPAKPQRFVVYGKHATKDAATVAKHTVPGSRVTRSAWRFLR